MERQISRTATRTPFYNLAIRGSFSANVAGSSAACSEGPSKIDHGTAQALGAERYAWGRDGGFFHPVTGVIGASGAIGDEFDALVDAAMAQDEREDE